MPNHIVPAARKGLPTVKRRARKLPPSKITADDLVVGRVSRQALENEIERLIGLLDAVDPDPDLESYVTGQPRMYGFDDLEGDDCDYEPSLGSLNEGAYWSAGGVSDLEMDTADDEPDLGSPTGGIGNQELGPRHRRRAQRRRAG